MGTKPLPASRSAEAVAGKCNSPLKRTDGLCKMAAGQRTDHPGQGRCWLHGGRSPIKSGRYSTIKRDEIRALIEKHESDPDPLNIMPELAAARALFQDFIERYDEWRAAILDWHSSWGTDSENPKPRQVLDLADAYRILSEVTKIAERIERIRAVDAIPRAEFVRLVKEFVRIVETHNGDPDPDRRLEKMRNDWLSVRVA